MLLQQNSSVVILLLLFIVMGAVFYLLDRSFGVRIYRWLYKMTHKDPLSSDEVRGFIYNRKAKVKFCAASVIALILSVISFWSGASGSNPLMEILSWFIEIPLVWIGFCAGAPIWSLCQKNDALFDKIDKIESGELDVTKEIRDAASSVAKDVINKASGAIDEVVGALSDNKSEGAEIKAEEKPQQPEEPEKSPEELMRDYLKK